MENKFCSTCGKIDIVEKFIKNCKIFIPQIERHLQKLHDYHEQHKINLPQKFSDLFARYLVAGSPLELSLPPTIGNICGELG